MTNTALVSLPVQPGLMYSGSDDSSWKAWDLRSNCSGAEQTPVWVNRRMHGAGVTSISSHPRHQHVVVTGSYDEYARVWDMRMASRPVSTAEVCGSRLDSAHCNAIPAAAGCIAACLHVFVACGGCIRQPESPVVTASKQTDRVCCMACARCVREAACGA